jgi:hypothetical protein
VGGKLKATIITDGLLDQAISVSDIFLDRGEVVSIRGRSADHTRRFDPYNGDLSDSKPLVALINGGWALREAVGICHLFEAVAHHSGALRGQVLRRGITSSNACRSSRDGWLKGGAHHPPCWSFCSNRTTNGRFSAPVT